MSITLDEFRQAKQSGVDLYQEAQEDAAPEQEEVQQEEQPEEQTEYQDSTEGEEQAEGALDEQEQEEEEDVPPLPKEQQNAFYKRLQRELKKKQAELEQKIKSELEQQYNPYKAFFERINLDPQKALEAIEQNQLRQEAERLADQYGWTEQQMQMYIRQQELERKQIAMQVELKIYELADSPDYPGIKQMKNEIINFIRANPSVPVEQAYWAVGGLNLVKQLQREAEQRMISKREQPKRKVVSDTTAPSGGPEPLPPEAVQFMREAGLSESEMRLLLSNQMPSNLEEYRKWKGRK